LISGNELLLEYAKISIDMSEDKQIDVYTDGGARGNPGPSAVGVVFQKNGKIVDSFRQYIGDTTNNQAEYQAVILALEKAEEQGYTHLNVYMDSLLVVEQINRRYKVKDAGLAKLFVEVWNKIQSFQSITFSYIPREKNVEADRLVNEALDEEAA
jgi:ribonuclease HI